MELTIVLSVTSESKDYELLDTLESLPWDKTGVDLLIYSGDTKRIKRVLHESDLESIVRESDVDVVFCETPEEGSHHTFGLEDTKSEGVMFLEAGDVIEDFQSDLIITGTPEPVGIPGVGQEGLPETIVCHEVRTLPESYRGMIFKAQWLRDMGLTQVDLDYPAKICSLLREKICLPNYWGGWSSFDISESLSVSLGPKDDKGMIKSLENFWKNGNHTYPPYIRDLVWNRMTTSAARLTTSNFSTYLYPANKLKVLD